MIDSRKIEDLHPILQILFHEMKKDLELQGIKIQVVSTYRDIAYQNYLYSQGRTSSGAIVTNVRGGYSYHNHRLALDVVPLDDYGKITWTPRDPKVWNHIGNTGMKYGMEWGGLWTSFVDRPHFQITFGLTTTQLVQGVQVPKSIIHGCKDRRLVLLVQGQLKKKGYALAQDGIFGNYTKVNVINYQRAHGLTPTGEVDARTLATFFVEDVPTETEKIHWVEANNDISYLEKIGIFISEKRYDEPMKRGEAFALAEKLAKVIIKP